jgi:hypothetical protein
MLLFRRHDPDPDGPHWSLFLAKRKPRERQPAAPNVSPAGAHRATQHARAPAPHHVTDPNSTLKHWPAASSRFPRSHFDRASGVPTEKVGRAAIRGHTSPEVLTLQDGRSPFLIMARGPAPWTRKLSSPSRLRKKTRGLELIW